MHQTDMVEDFVAKDGVWLLKTIRFDSLGAQNLQNPKNRFAFSVVARTHSSKEMPFNSASFSAT